MNWFTSLLTSTLGRKMIMALTGLFLVLFLVIHLIGNLQLLKSDGGNAFNVYAQFMGHNPLIQTVSIGNFAFILIHAIWALLLTLHNRRSRGEVGYAVSNNSSAWMSRSMGILGTLILIFLIVHLQGFWFQMKFGNVPFVTVDGKDVKDLYTVVDAAYQNIGFVALYVFSMCALGFHLWHGFASAFQTLGLNHLKYNPIIRFVGRAYAIIVPALFAIIPIWMYLN
ncbi:succinate dehydrogenase cytochrome b subunit [Chryseolinea lacunae]|uniref:Succinate dehydrogenase cytochrome b subunit n=1 Tax=Chryseolinea lacunae TaxID=2801331 RepID=A0ABS1KT93_9BACT|nr:succinate dehydrogenase cytochrome b subunit [Chryseolinea lacunae]MBL0742665.1 succinate dehydrogenase cytochrome b subunit [Chryseolinea lacunae]